MHLWLVLCEPWMIILQPLSTKLWSECCSLWSLASLALAWWVLTAGSSLPHPFRKLSRVHACFCVRKSGGRRAWESRKKKARSHTSLLCSEMRPAPGRQPLVRLYVLGEVTWETVGIILSPDFLLCKPHHKMFAATSSTHRAAITKKHNSHSLWVWWRPIIPFSTVGFAVINAGVILQGMREIY